MIVFQLPFLPLLLVHLYPDFCKLLKSLLPTSTFLAISHHVYYDFPTSLFLILPSHLCSHPCYLWHLPAFSCTFAHRGVYSLIVYLWMHFCLVYHQPLFTTIVSVHVSLWVVWSFPVLHITHQNSPLSSLLWGATSSAHSLLLHPTSSMVSFFSGFI